MEPKDETILTLRDELAETQSELERARNEVEVPDWNIIASRLRLEEGDIVIVRCSDCIADHTKIDKWMKALAPKIGPTGLMIMLTEDTDIKALKPAHMNEAGWYRREGDKQGGDSDSGLRDKAKGSESA